MYTLDTRTIFCFYYFIIKGVIVERRLMDVKEKLMDIEDRIVDLLPKN